MNSIPEHRESAIRALASTLTLCFKFLAWANGLGLATVFACGTGVIAVDLAAVWLRFPMAVFLAGLALAVLGLLWSYPVQGSLLYQAIHGRARRTHWIPLFCTLLAYAFSLLAFCIGCWFFQALLEAL